MSNEKLTYMKFGESFLGLRFLILLCIIGFVAWHFVEFDLVRRKVHFWDACGSGVLIENCIGKYGNPEARYVDQNTNRYISYWSSSKAIYGMADLAIVHKDGVILEVINMDKEAGRLHLERHFDLQEAK